MLQDFGIWLEKGEGCSVSEGVLELVEREAKLCFDAFKVRFITYLLVASTEYSNAIVYLNAYQIYLWTELICIHRSHYVQIVK